jgi:PTS system nitrogen regulatory IIA component
MPTSNTSTPVVLNEKRVFILKDNISKKDLVAKLVNAICDDLPGIDREDMLNAVAKREQGISTTLDTGLSIPHARIEDLEDFQAAVAVLPGGINDEFGLKIKVMFLFLSPAGPAFFSRHLKLLASLAEKLNAQFITELASAVNKQEILSKISF